MKMEQRKKNIKIENTIKILDKIDKYKIWDKKYSRPYYKFNNKIFHSKFEFYDYLKINKI